MTYTTVNGVKYYSKGNYYIVGDNSSNYANGILDKNFEGEITIFDNINGKRVLELGQYAFSDCRNLTKVFIKARIRSINTWAFVWCLKLNYINIPETVKFMGSLSIFLSNHNDEVLDVPITVEFNKGRTLGLYMYGWIFSQRKTVHVIYPCSIVPNYLNDNPFHSVSNAIICAPSSFIFYSKPTTTDQSKCPTPLDINWENYRFISIAIYKIRRFAGMLLRSLTICILCER